MYQNIYTSCLQLFKRRRNSQESMKSGKWSIGRQLKQQRPLRPSAHVKSRAWCWACSPGSLRPRVGRRLTSKLASPEQQGPSPREGSVSENKVDGACGGMPEAIFWSLRECAQMCRYVHTCMCTRCTENKKRRHKYEVGG